MDRADDPDVPGAQEVQNLGGIGNVAYLPPMCDQDTPPLAFDTGPANVLIDVLMTSITQGEQTYDKDGATDCADPDCACDPACVPPNETNCSEIGRA